MQSGPLGCGDLFVGADAAREVFHRAAVLQQDPRGVVGALAHAAKEIAAAVRVEPEVTDYQVYAGVASPFNFNGLVRHYFMRGGANVADIQVNLVGKNERAAKSRDIAKRVRPRVAAIAAKYGARVAVAEVPPGPPVLQTLVAEIYGPTEESRLIMARKVRDIYVLMVGWFRSFLTPSIVMVAIPFSLVGILPAHGALGVDFTP